MDQEIVNLLLECNYEVADTESEEDVAELEEHFASKGATLPSELKDVYLEIGAGEGVCKGQPFRIWSALDVIERDKKCEGLPVWKSYIVFGSDGANEGFAFDITKPGLPVVLVPMIGLSKPEDAKVKGDNFKSFLLHGIDTSVPSEQPPSSAGEKDPEGQKPAVTKSIFVNPVRPKDAKPKR